MLYDLHIQMGDDMRKGTLPIVSAELGGRSVVRYNTKSKWKKACVELAFTAAVFMFPVAKSKNVIYG